MSPEHSYRLEDIARSYLLAVERGTVDRGKTHPDVQSKLSELGNFIGDAMHDKGTNSVALAMKAGVTLDEVIAIKCGVGTLRETRESLPRIALALGISTEQVPLSILQLVWPENARGWLVP